MADDEDAPRNPRAGGAPAEGDNGIVMVSIGFVFFHQKIRLNKTLFNIGTYFQYVGEQFREIKVIKL